MDLGEILNQQHLSATEIQSRTARIHDRLLTSSRVMHGPNFQSISAGDLKQLFRDYDAEFFDGQLGVAMGESPLLFRLSSRLTSSAGMMTRRTRRDVPLSLRKSLTGNVRYEFEIAVSTTILFQSFTDPATETKATGLVCRNRLEALQRVFEHELVHLAETLVWLQSKCSRPRFQSIAKRLFGHLEHTHRLVTSRDHAWKKYGFRVGDLVTFAFEQQRHVGRINRISRRATILVQDASGTRYTDGKRYKKFYVPLPMLKRIENKAAS